MWTVFGTNWLKIFSGVKIEILTKISVTVESKYKIGLVNIYSLALR